MVSENEGVKGEREKGNKYFETLILTPFEVIDGEHLYLGDSLSDIVRRWER